MQMGRQRRFYNVHLKCELKAANKETRHIIKLFLLFIVSILKVNTKNTVLV